MRKLFYCIVLLLSVVMFTGCADSKTFKDKEGKEIVAEPFGFANEYKAVPGVIYEPCLGNLVWSILGCETVVIPVWLIGYEFYEPVMYDPESPYARKSYNPN